MTLHEVYDRLAEIDGLAKKKDWEVAHMMEDELFIDVLKALAPREPLAALALKSLDMKIVRWYA